MTNYKLSGDSKGESLVVIYDESDPVTVPGTHPRFDEILTLLRSGSADDESVETLVDTMGMLGKRLAVITDRVSVTPYAVYFDGDQLDGELAHTFVELYNEGKDSALRAVANFLDKASQNASMDSVRALYAWIKNGDLVLKENGNFVAYKGVRKTADGSLESITHGKAWVDGVEYTGAIPNPLGAVVSMPRSSVDADGSVGCSVGLHAGTYAYASSFAQGALLVVEINPRDVVSVPSDCTFQKLRVSKYTVLEEIEQRMEKRLWTEEAWEDYEDDGDFTDDQPVDYEEQPQAFSDLRSQPILPLIVTPDEGIEEESPEIAVDGGILADNLLPEASVTNNYVTNNFNIKAKNLKVDSTGAVRGPDGKFVKGGKIQMERDEFGHFIGKKKKNESK